MPKQFNYLHQRLMNQYEFSLSFKYYHVAADSLLKAYFSGGRRAKELLFTRSYSLIQPKCRSISAVDSNPKRNDFTLGIRALAGIGMPVSRRKAVLYFKRGYETEGNAYRYHCAMMLGYCHYFDGLHTSDLLADSHFELAFTFFGIASIHLPEARVGFSQCLVRGRGIAPSGQRAWTLLQDNDSPKAKYCLGLLAMISEKPQLLETGLTALQAAATSGLLEAQLLLLRYSISGLTLNDKVYIEQNLDLAAEWFDKALDQCITDEDKFYFCKFISKHINIRRNLNTQQHEDMAYLLIDLLDNSEINANALVLQYLNSCCTGPDKDNCVCYDEFFDTFVAVIKEESIVDLEMSAEIQQLAPYKQAILLRQIEMNQHRPQLEKLLQSKLAASSDDSGYFSEETSTPEVPFINTRIAFFNHRLSMKAVCSVRGDMPMEEIHKSHDTPRVDL